MTRSRSRRSEGRPAAVRVGGLFDHSPVISPRANRIGAIVKRSSRCRRARQVDFSAKTVSAVAGEFHHWPPVVVAARMTAAWGFRNAAVPLDRRVRVRVRAPVPGVRPCATKAPGRLRDVPRVRKPDLWGAIGHSSPVPRAINRRAHPAEHCDMRVTRTNSKNPRAVANSSASGQGASAWLVTSQPHRRSSTLEN
jgi:hypothetical protein